MGFHCIACNSDKSISYTMKNAKVADLISIAFCQTLESFFIRENLANDNQM